MSDQPGFIHRAPDGWSILPLRLIGQIANGATPSSGEPSYWDGDVVWVTPDDLGKLIERDLTTSARKLTQAGYLSCGTRLVPENSIILSTRAPIGHLAIARVKACLNQGCRAITLNRDHVPEFFFYQLYAAKGDLASLGTGSTFRELSREKLSGFKLLVPPVETQRAIADFLDRETAKIDALIAKQEELIAQIEEKRAATITQAVTKGLNPTVAMRPSGFEWIGDIPEHWLVRPLKRQASRIVVGIAEAATHAYADAGVPIIRSTNVFPNRIETHNLLFLQAQFAGDRASKMIRAGDLLTARTGNAGVTAVVPDDLDGSQCFTMLITSLRNGYIPKYFCYFINSKAGTTFYDLESWGTAQRNISVPILGDTPVCVPPTCEQEAIADFVSGQERNFEALRAAAVRHCDLLVEHRSALITAAVTGQIDVRATPTQPIAIAANDNRQALRAVVGAEIVSRQGSAKNFGRVKLQKLIYLAEVHAGIHELAGNYVRQAAGPLAPDLLSETERGMEAGGFYRTVPPTNEGDGYIYSRIGKAGAHGDQFAAMLGDRAATLTQLIDRFKDYDTRQVEAITTLYAVWNDALIDGETPTDDRIIRGVLEEWHPEKKDKFTATDLKPWLAWMRRNGVVPTGTGSRTQLDRLFV